MIGVLEGLAHKQLKGGVRGLRMPAPHDQPNAPTKLLMPQVAIVTELLAAASVNLIATFGGNVGHGASMPASQCAATSAHLLGDGLITCEQVCHVGFCGEWPAVFHHLP